MPDNLADRAGDLLLRDCSGSQNIMLTLRKYRSKKKKKKNPLHHKLQSGHQFIENNRMNNAHHRRTRIKESEREKIF